MAVTNCASYVPIQYLILAQLVIFLRASLPLSIPPHVKFQLITCYTQRLP
jgi:hypothetical protein